MQRTVRIRELRKAAGLTSDQLGAAIGVSGAQMRRLESEARELTVSTLVAIARVLGVSPPDLISISAIGGFKDDVIPLTAEGAFAQALALSDVGVYRVLSDAVIDSGIPAGKEITVLKSPAALAAAKGGDVVLVSLRDAGADELQSYLCLRVLVPPALLVTNRHGSNVPIRLDDPAIDAKLIGVVAPS